MEDIVRPIVVFIIIFVPMLIVYIAMKKKKR